MPTILASTIIDRASGLLQDPTNVRWSRAEHLTHLNAGQRALVLFKPNAYTKSALVTLVAGTKQSLPDEAAGLIDIPRNDAGPAITVSDRKLMDAQNPNWHAATASATVKHYFYNALDVRRFYVYPPAIAGSKVEAVYPATPPNIAENAVILVDDIYEDALLNYVMFRAYSKDTEYAASANMAALYYGAFKELLTGKTNAESAVNPNA